MPKGKTRRQTTYQYQAGDDPTQLAQQFGTTPQQLINANPGGYPFNTGQMINLPQALPVSSNPLGNFQYSPAPIQSAAERNVPRPYQNVVNATTGVYAQQRQQVQQPTTAPQPTASQAFRTRDEISMPTVEVFQNGLQRLAEGADLSTFSAPEQAALIKLMVDNGLLPPGTTARDLQNQQGQVTTGAAPFGVNQQGQRLDIYGNAWNPETAQRDIYGGEFRQPGETRWRRNAAGNIIKEVLVSGNNWVRVRSGGGGGGGSGKSNLTDPKENKPNITGFGVVSFGAGAG